MSSETNRTPGKNFVEIFDRFGDALSEIFNDPELKEQARQFGKSAANSVTRFSNRFKDEEVKTKFRDVGKAAEEFGRSVADYFKPNKPRDS